MQSTNSAVHVRDLLRTVAVAALPWSPFVWLASAGDPYQPVRSLALALALALTLATASERDDGSGRLARWAAWTTAVLGVLYVLAWLAGGLPSGLFGVHGRFAGMLTGLLFVGAGLAGSTFGVRDVRVLGRSGAVALAAQAAFVFVQFMGGTTPDTTFGNRVLLGSWLALAVSVSFALARGERGRWRVLEYASAMAGALALGMVGSRGAWVGAFLGVGVTVLAGRIRGRTLAAVAVVVLAAALVAALGGGEAASKLDPRSLAGGSAASRAEIWRGTGAMIVSNPALGIGPGRFLYEFPAFETQRHVEIEGFEVRADQAHSLPLQLAAEAGIPAAAAGIVLFGVAILAALRGARRRSAASLMCLAGLVAFGGQGVFGISIVETDTLAWLLGGAAIALLAQKGAPRAPHPWRVRVAGLTLVAAVGVGAAYYLVADVAYLSGLERFAQADFSGSLLRFERATALDPYIDVYRVGAADAASYLGDQAAQDALASLDTGLELEPRSYDLAVARARLLGGAGSDPRRVAQAYEVAVALYPLGLDVRHETMLAYLEAGRESEARALADGVLQSVPDDPVALQVKELVHE